LLFTIFDSVVVINIYEHKTQFFKNIGCVVILFNFKGHIYKVVVPLQGHTYSDNVRKIKQHVCV